MQSSTDTELLREYAHRGSEAAFGEIVRRYADFVYSAALRQVSDPESARDVAQVVFVDLARKAASLHTNTLLIGWLCRGARLAALEHLRRQRRRVQRETLAMQLADSSTDTLNDWSAVRPALDDALARLGEEDRNALLLRFFKNESLAAVGATLGVSEDAAQKRVSRALGKLRDFLAERGIHTTAAALSVVLAANAVQAAPAGLAASLTAGALAQAAAAHAFTPLLHFLNTHQMKTAILSLILASGVAGLTVQQVHTARQVSAAQATIQQQSDSLQALQSVQDQLAARSAELERLRDQGPELARLRSEVGRLRQLGAAQPKSAPTETVSASAAATTNAPVSSIGLTAKFFLLPTEDLKTLSLNWSGNTDGTATEQLTADQFQTLTQALDGASDVKSLGSPRVVTSSGMEARLFVGPKMSGASAGGGFFSSTMSGSGGGAVGGGFGGPAGFGGNSALPQDLAGGATNTEARPGLSLRVLPAYTEGASIFDLDITAGFTQWVDNSAQQDGSQKELQTTKTKLNATALPAGQTMLLAKEVSAEGWTEADATVPGPKTLLVFITPSVVHTVSRLARIVHSVTPNSTSEAKAN
jgi:RNA polymerase sigma factor (sigma-70 family)